MLLSQTSQMQKTRTCRHILTVDIEEHFHDIGFDSVARRRYWNDFESRAKRNVDRLLDLLNEHKVHATCFVLGWVAERHPTVVRRLAAEGHEIASYGYGHDDILNLTAGQFRKDVRKSKNLLEDLIGGPVLGYRAPCSNFSLEPFWMRNVLLEEGYRYDASSFRTRLPDDGRSQASSAHGAVVADTEDLLRVPARISPFGLRSWNTSNVGYLRMCPLGFLEWTLNQAGRDDHTQVCTIKLWELDSSQPKMKGPLFARIQHYMSLEKMPSRLKRLFKMFSFVPILDTLPAIHPSFAFTLKRMQLSLEKESPSPLQGVMSDNGVCSKVAS